MPTSAVTNDERVEDNQNVLPNAGSVWGYLVDNFGRHTSLLRSTFKEAVGSKLDKNDVF